MNPHSVILSIPRPLGGSPSQQRASSWSSNTWKLVRQLKWQHVPGPLNFSNPRESSVGRQGAEMRLAHLRSLDPRPPQRQGRSAGKGPGRAQSGVGAAARVAWETQSRGSTSGGSGSRPGQRGRGARAQGQQRSIARTHRVPGPGPCRGPEGGGPRGWRAVGGAAQGARQAPRRGCPAPQPAGAGAGLGPGRAPGRLTGSRQCSPRRGRGPSVLPAQRGGARAPAPRPPRGPRPAPREEESRLRTEEARQPRAAPVGALPARGAERRRAGSRGARAGPPQPRRPARRYLRRPGGAANRKLESARGAAAALSPRRPEARPPQPGVSLQPGSSELASAATRRARERLPGCSDLPEPPPSPGRFPR